MKLKWRVEEGLISHRAASSVRQAHAVATKCGHRSDHATMDQAHRSMSIAAPFDHPNLAQSPQLRRRRLCPTLALSVGG